MSGSARNRLHVVAGAGVAAVETLLALRALAGQRVDITVVSPEREFLYRRSRSPRCSSALKRVRIRLARSSPAAAAAGSSGTRRQASNRTSTSSSRAGERISYDALVVAAGALAREPLPDALTFRARMDVPALRRLLDELVAGTARSVALALPSERM